MMENEGANTLIELRSRNRGFPTTSAAGGGGWAPREDEKVFIEHVVQPTDSLYKIGLQYSVPVSEIKRVNNIGTEQEIHAVKQLRIPVSRLRQHFLNEKNAAAASSSGGAALIDVNSPSATPLVGVSEKTALLGDSSEDEERSDGSAKSAIDALFDKTDATVAQARNQLPSPTLEGGAFHFVDASAPDSAAKGWCTWLLIIGVVLMFVVVPLVLTMLEEHSEAEHEIHHHQNHHLS
ncbi:LysM and putative peptidoglycan-binding domain-containing protein 3 [Aphelenchoides fujianensis]|nr:LysM and putative peptidoglycan-binding domain-containing protein 3 [Aphelenchoides fujianensis]